MYPALFNTIKKMYSLVGFVSPFDNTGFPKKKFIFVYFENFRAKYANVIMAQPLEDHKTSFVLN